MPVLDDATTRPQPPGFGGKPGGPFTGKEAAASPEDSFVVAVLTIAPAAGASIALGPAAGASIALGPAATGAIRINEGA